MTTTEEVIRLAREMADTVCNEIGPVAMCKDPLSFAQEVGVRLIDLVRAEENEACAEVCLDLGQDEDNSIAYRNGAVWCSERIRARRAA